MEDLAASPDLKPNTVKALKRFFDSRSDWALFGTYLYIIEERFVTLIRFTKIYKRFLFLFFFIGFLAFYLLVM